MSIIAPIPRPERRRMQKAIQSTKDKGLARRLIAILALNVSWANSPKRE